PASVVFPDLIDPAAPPKTSLDTPDPYSLLVAASFRGDVTRTTERALAPGSQRPLEESLTRLGSPEAEKMLVPVASRTGQASCTSPEIRSAFFSKLKALAKEPKAAAPPKGKNPPPPTTPAGPVVPLHNPAFQALLDLGADAMHEDAIGAMQKWLLENQGNTG